MFYGSPGTGKTETVYQLARRTQRDIMVIDVSQIKSCWVGESEKNIKNAFDRYRSYVKQCERAPILLFNEADAVLGIRQEGAQRAVEKMENSIQNIILQEMEQLDGQQQRKAQDRILICNNKDMNNFAAIDFETANECRTSVCSVGVVVVRGGEIVDRFYSLIHPEPDYYRWFCMEVHGLCDDDTRNAPLFPEVWRQIEPLIGDLPLVAHNARFDEGCLREAHRAYGMDYPEYEFYDTLQASHRTFGNSLPNHQLQTTARACGYDLTAHHHALADAEAAAAIALRIL